MKAAVLHAPGSLVVEEVVTPACPDRGLLVKVDVCSICHSDIKMSKVGHRDLRYPRILGHEIAGRVVSSRTRNKALTPGTRVQVWPGLACGECPSCIRGHDNQCSDIGILGFNEDGGFAEYLAVPEDCVARKGVNPIPANVSSEAAALTEPLACCINAQDAGRIGKGDIVVVFGAGPLGALHVMLAKSRGASVVVVEKAGDRRETIRQAKPDLVVDPENEEVAEALKASTGSPRADAVILATPQVRIDDDLIGLLAPRGRLCLFSGLPHDSEESSLNLNSVHYLERTIYGSYGCGSADDREALRLIASGRLDVSWLITRRLPLEDIVDGIEYAAGRQGMKAVVTME